ncbi:MAG: methyltransferase domain-containing protein [Holosporales bacterium]
MAIPVSSPLFDLCAIRQCQQRAMPGIHRHRLLYDLALETLTERFSEIKTSFSKRIILNDVFHLATTLGTPITDEEALTLPGKSIDSIVSFMALHHTNDILGYLQHCYRLLRPGGLFLAIFLGEESLIELRHTLAEAEHHVCGGYNPRVAPMLDIKTAGSLLQKAGFAMPMADRQRITFHYDDFFSLCRDMRGMSLSNSLTLRQKYFSRRAVFTAAATFYKERHATSTGHLPLTFEYITLTGWH